MIGGGKVGEMGSEGVRLNTYVDSKGIDVKFLGHVTEAGGGDLSRWYRILTKVYFLG